MSVGEALSKTQIKWARADSDHGFRAALYNHLIYASKREAPSCDPPSQGTLRLFQSVTNTYCLSPGTYRYHPIPL